MVRSPDLYMVMFPSFIQFLFKVVAMFLFFSVPFFDELNPWNFQKSVALVIQLSPRFLVCHCVVFCPRKYRTLHVITLTSVFRNLVQNLVASHDRSKWVFLDVRAWMKFISSEETCARVTNVIVRLLRTVFYFILRMYCIVTATKHAQQSLWMNTDTPLCDETVMIGIV